MVHDLLENRCIDGLAIDKLLLCYHTKQIDFMSLLVCIVIDHRRLQYVVSISVTHLCLMRHLFCFHCFLTSSVIYY